MEVLNKQVIGRHNQELKTINYVSRSSKLFLSIESDFSVPKRGFSARVSKVVRSLIEKSFPRSK